MKATGSFLPPTMPEHAESPPLPYINIFATMSETGTTPSALFPNAEPFKLAFPQHMPAAGSQTSGFLPYARASSSVQAARSSQVPIVVNAGPSQASGITPGARASFSAAGSSQVPINVDTESSAVMPGARRKLLVPDPDAGFVPDARGAEDGDEDANGSKETCIESETCQENDKVKTGKSTSSHNINFKTGTRAPAPMPSTSKPVPVPAPNPSTSKKRKVMKSLETVNSKRSEDEDEMDWSHWPEHWQMFLEFECQNLECRSCGVRVGIAG